MGVPQGFVAAVTSLTDEPSLLILLMIGILIAAGCVMETTPNIVILAPILKPLADNIGMNEIQFCIMMITALGCGFHHPAAGSEPVRCFRPDGRVDPENRWRACALCTSVHADRDP